VEWLLHRLLLSPARRSSYRSPSNELPSRK
jgi:hypothetical protein